MSEEAVICRLKIALQSRSRTVTDALELALAAENNAPKSSAELRDLLAHAGVDMKSTRNAGALLRQSKGVIATPQGFELTRDRLSSVAAQLLEGEDQGSQVSNKTLNSAQSNGISPPVVFFGHGRSEDWRVLKDHVVDRLGCKHEEYNREPTAGLSRKERLLVMLDRAKFAVLVMTAEDQMESGEWRARENVVHEVGLFQGKLTFERAIVVLQDGCNEFSNIAGLDQLRYKHNILEVAHEIRDILVREQLIRS